MVLVEMLVRKIFALPSSFLNHLDVLEDLIQANEDLAKRKGLTDDNKSLDKKLQEANEKFKKMVF